MHGMKSWPGNCGMLVWSLLELKTESEGFLLLEQLQGISMIIAIVLIGDGRTCTIKCDFFAYINTLSCLQKR